MSALRWLLVALGFALALVAPKAHAGTIQQAWAQCQVDAAGQFGQSTQYAAGSYCGNSPLPGSGHAAGTHIEGCTVHKPPLSTCWYIRDYTYTTGCPAGTNFDYSTGNPTSGTCVDPNAHCATMRTATTGPGNDMVTSLFGPFPKCLGGCTYDVQGPDRQSTDYGGTNITTGDFGYSGTACAATPDSPAPATKPADSPEAKCKPAADGQSFCVKANGEQCYTTTVGKMVCFKNGELGAKTDGAKAVSRCGGSSPCPAPSAPPGETLTAEGTPKTVTTETKSSGTVVNNNTTTANTYVTNYGTNAGTTNSGESTTGTSTSGGSTSGGTSGNGSSGGQDCATPYTTTGDPVAGAALKEAWKANCHWQAEKDALESADHSDGTEGQTEGEAKESIWKQGDASNLANRYGTGITENAFGGSSGGSCPHLPVVDLGELGEINPNSDKLCEAVLIARWVIIFLAYGMALRMVV